MQDDLTQGLSGLSLHVDFFRIVQNQVHVLVKALRKAEHFKWAPAGTGFYRVVVILSAAGEVIRSNLKQVNMIKTKAEILLVVQDNDRLQIPAEHMAT